VTFFPQLRGTLEKARSPRLDQAYTGASALYLAPYLSDFSPIEEAFSNIKATLPKMEARTQETLVEAIGQALDAVSCREALGWFSHCGYQFIDQPT
jgi:hypothetical protein